MEGEQEKAESKEEGRRIVGEMVAESQGYDAWDVRHFME